MTGVGALPLAGTCCVALLGLNAWWTARDGQSVGKRWVDIRIVEMDGRVPTFFRGVVLRSWVVGLAYQVLGAWALFDPLFVFRRDRRTLHDLLTGTRVVLGSAPFTRRW